MNEIIKKPNALIIVKNQLTVNEHKLFNVALKLLVDSIETSNTNIIKTSFKELKNLSGISDNKRIKDALKGLYDNEIHFENSDLKSHENNDLWKSLDELNLRFISMWGYKTATEEFLIELPNSLFEVMKEDYLFAPLDLKIIKGLNQKHSLWLYEALSDYKGIRKKTYTIKQIRHFAGLEDKQYTATKDLRVYVIDKAIKEINSKTKLKVSSKIIKQGRKIIAFEFNIFDNGKSEILESKKFRAFFIAFTKTQPNEEHILNNELHIAKNEKGKFFIYDTQTNTPIGTSEALVKWKKIYELKYTFFDTWAKTLGYDGIDEMMNKFTI